MPTLKYHNGTAFIERTAKRYDGADFVDAALKVRDGGAWVDVGASEDADATAFLVASANDGDATISSAINDLVVALKASGVWTKCQAIYPFAGGTAAKHKWNLKDPRDLDAAFRIAWNGTLTHNANGVASNGSTGYGDTRLNSRSGLTQYNAHLSCYVQSNSGAADVYEIGTADGSGGYFALRARYTSDQKGSWMYTNPTTNAVAGSITDARGFMIGSRRANNDHELYQDGTGVTTNTATESSQAPSETITIGGVNFGFAVLAHSPRTIAFASVGSGLTDTEVADYYTAVQAFQTALSRQV